LFGAGFGDPAGDLAAYNEGQADALRDAAADAGDVDSIITTCLGLDSESVQIRFIVPQANVEHLNQELFTALFALGYDPTRTYILVHPDDLDAATCGTGADALPCCGDSACNSGDARFGAPYDSPWDAETLARVEPLASGDDCNAPVLTFDTPGLGPWRVVATPDQVPDRSP
jgi:hypothetical protein